MGLFGKSNKEGGYLKGEGRLSEQEIQKAEDFLKKHPKSTSLSGFSVSFHPGAFIPNVPVNRHLLEKQTEYEQGLKNLGKDAAGLVRAEYDREPGEPSPIAEAKAEFRRKEVQKSIAERESSIRNNGILSSEEIQEAREVFASQAIVPVPMGQKQDEQNYPRTANGKDVQALVDQYHADYKASYFSVADHGKNPNSPQNVMVRPLDNDPAVQAVENNKSSPRITPVSPQPMPAPNFVPTPPSAVPQSVDPTVAKPDASQNVPIAATSLPPRSGGDVSRQV